MMQQIITALLIVLASWFLLRLTFHGSRALKKKIIRRAPSRFNEQIVNFTERFIAIVVIAAALLLILPVFGLNINGLLAIGGMGGILISFIMKDVLTNILGGVTVYFDDLFLRGDMIALPEKNVQGTVEMIRWRQTIIRSLDKRIIIVPNAIFINSILENLSRKKHFHFQTTVRLQPMELPKFKQMVEDIRAHLQKHIDIDAKEKIAVYLSSVAHGSFDLIINVYLKTDDEKVKQEILLSVLEIAIIHGGELNERLDHA